jgi:transcriptional antiterminator NusG
MDGEVDPEDAEVEDEPDPEELSGQVFVIKTTINQEENVAKMVQSKAEREGAPVLATLAPNELRGYLFVEAAERRPLEEIAQNIRHAKTLLDSKTDIADIEHFLTPKPAVEGIEEGDIVELSEGPFKGERARVQRIDEKAEEITVELFEAMVPIPVTVRGDHVRVLKKDEEAEDVGAA